MCQVLAQYLFLSQKKSPHISLHPFHLNNQPNIQTQMEEFIIVLYDRIQELVVERLTAYDPVTYVAKWDTLRTSVDSVLQNLKSFTYEIVASTSHRQEQLEEEMTLVASKQDKMDTWVQYVFSKKYVMGPDIKSILEILKKIP